MTTAICGRERHRADRADDHAGAEAGKAAYDAGDADGEHQHEKRRIDRNAKDRHELFPEKQRRVAIARPSREGKARFFVFFLFTSRMAKANVDLETRWDRRFA
jgi:hypothetical protein